MAKNRGRNRAPQKSQSQAQQAATVRTQEITQQYARSGPLPSADEMERYYRLDPKLVDRIVTMAEGEADHRRSIEVRDATRLENTTENAAAAHRRGQWFGGILSLSALAVSAFLGFLGHAVTAGAVGTTTVLGLVSVFVVGKLLKPGGK